MKRGSFVVLALIMLAVGMPAEAQQAATDDVEERGSVIVFPKFTKGVLERDNVSRPRTEIELRVRCPRGGDCPESESVKIRFHWVCPGSDDIASKYVCKGAGFDIRTSVDGKVSFNPEDPNLSGNNPASSAPCPNGYLIGWVINPDTNRPIKYDGLSGGATLWDSSSGAVEKYRAITIEAATDLPTRAEVTTDIDPRSGTPALVFDGAAGHYQGLDAGIPQDLEYQRLSGPLSSNEGFLILLTLDVRLSRPNYPVFVDLNFRSDQGIRASTSKNFTCWTEIQSPKIGETFTLAGARARNRIIISGRAAKVPFGGISDIPGPVTLLGLVPTEEGHGGRSMDSAYMVNWVQQSKPMTVFLPFE